VGPIASSAAGPALPLAQAAKIPVIMIASAPQFTSLGEYMFRVYPSDSYQGNIGAEFMVNELKVKKVALMYTQNDYGQNLAKVFKEKFVSLGGEITFEGSYPDTTAPDFRTDIAKIKTSDSQAIYSVLYPANAVVSFRQLKEMKVNLPIMGADGYSGEEVTGNTFADGVIFGVVKTNMRDEFTAKIKSLTGFTDLQVAAPALFAYDATNALLTAIKEAGSTDGTKIKNALGKVSVAGVSNEMIKFGPDREVENPSFEIRVIKNKTSVPYVKN
jgi:branched-chain amino acid transport system substrate-binding protein